jgi:hypothetical protein
MIYRNSLRRQLPSSERSGDDNEGYLSRVSPDPPRRRRPRLRDDAAGYGREHRNRHALRSRAEV